MPANNSYFDQFDALDSGLVNIEDPGASGTIYPSKAHNSLSIVTLASAGTNALESASVNPIGAQLLVIAQAAVTAGGVTLADGEHALFRVTLDSSGARRWSLESVASTVAASTFGDDTDLIFGDGSDVKVEWSTNDASNNTFVIGLGDTNQALHITDVGAKDTDWNVSADTDPTVYIHSNTTPATDYLLIGGHDGTTAGIDVVGGTTLDLRIAGSDVLQVTATGITIAVAEAGLLGQGSNVGDFRPAAASDNITAGTGGAVAITNYYTTINTDAGGDAFTLADGAHVGQLKLIRLIVDGGGDGVLTPANLSGGTTITFADAGDYALLKWDGTDWVALELGNSVDGVSAPVLA